ncbi:hypothetical protein GALMADRAFT_229283 [Galerina marginata CBS 339.88]|uniref:MYND-type domain-containing protein n=1 Tax=Galerina marginata (strain CBS 339.88) TaxID=685588 RepID=A0A067SNW7_GALM3|nr:hypothetical protein GALMADRAFT_229283 [Galerina marginata CBS 339.88]
MRCSVCKVEPQKPLRCSQCKKTMPACQKADWKVHKRSVCTKPAILHKVDKMMKKYGGPNSTMGMLNSLEKAAWDERKRNPQPVSDCDGCFRRFLGEPQQPDDEEDEDINTGDPPARFKRCAVCDYTICEACTHPANQGIPYFDRPRGTCRCPKSNFGVFYCLSAPSYLDGDGQKPYHGDRHPDISSEEGRKYAPNAWEPRERACRTCGLVTKCLKKEHLKDALPGMA